MDHANNDPPSGPEVSFVRHSLGIARRYTRRARWPARFCPQGSPAAARPAPRPVRGSAASLPRRWALFRCAQGVDRRGAAQVGTGRLLQYVRARNAGRRRPRPSRLLCRLGGAVPPLRAAELADALCHQPLGLRAEPAAREGHRRSARAHAGADDGRRGIDVLRPVRAGRRLRRRGAGHAGAPRRQRLAARRPQDLDVQRAGRRLLHRLRHHRSRAGGGAAGRHQRLPGADRVAGLRGPARHQAVRPYRRRRGRASPRGRAGRAVAARGRAASGLRGGALRRVAGAHLQFGARRRLRTLGARARPRLCQDAQGLRPADRRLSGRDLSAWRKAPPSCTARI